MNLHFDLLENYIYCCQKAFYQPTTLKNLPSFLDEDFVCGFSRTKLQVMVECRLINLASGAAMMYFVRETKRW